MAMSRDVFCGESPGTFIALRISRSEPRGRHRDPKARECGYVFAFTIVEGGANLPANPHATATRRPKLRWRRRWAGSASRSF